jgi:hypothetical protein
MRIKINYASLSIRTKSKRPTRQILLPYYQTENVGLGKMENLQFTHIEKAETPGVYKIEFRTVGQPIYKTKTAAAITRIIDFFDIFGEDVYTHNRFVKDSVIVATNPLMCWIFVFYLSIFIQVARILFLVISMNSFLFQQPFDN